MSTTPTTSPTTGTTQTPPAMGTAQVFGGPKTLDKDSFLKLLVTQLQYQDPLNPTDNTEFVAQMAQFSSLEQMQNMNGGMSKLLTLSLMGKAVSGKDDDDQAVKGPVTGIKFGDAGAINLTVAVTGADGKTSEVELPIANVTVVAPEPTPSTAETPSQGG